jgi:hypothetical protein
VHCSGYYSRINLCFTAEKQILVWKCLANHGHLKTTIFTSLVYDAYSWGHWRDQWSFLKSGSHVKVYSPGCPMIKFNNILLERWPGWPLSRPTSPPTLISLSHVNPGNKRRGGSKRFPCNTPPHCHAPRVIAFVSYCIVPELLLASAAQKGVQAAVQ